MCIISVFPLKNGHIITYYFTDFACYTYYGNYTYYFGYDVTDSDNINMAI